MTPSQTRAVQRRLMANAHAKLIQQAHDAHGWRPDDVVDMLIAVGGSQPWLEELYAEFQRRSQYALQGMPDTIEAREDHGTHVLNYVRYHATRDPKEQSA